MKSGASFTDRNNIRAYVEAGQSNAVTISERLNIKVEVVQSFVDLYTKREELTRGQKAAATRAANKAAKEAESNQDAA